jgi:hypothetical protein
MFTKQAIAALLLANVSAVDTNTEAQQIVAGLLSGITGAEIGDLSQCTGDFKVVADDAEIIVKDLELKTKAGVKAGLKEVSVMLKDVLVLSKNCKALNIKGNVKKIEALIAIFSNPTSLSYHIAKDLIIHGKDIYKQIHASLVAYHAEEFFMFGKDIGTAAAELIIGEEAELKASMNYGQVA